MCHSKGIYNSLGVKHEQATNVCFTWRTDIVTRKYDVTNLMLSIKRDNSHKLGMKEIPDTLCFSSVGKKLQEQNPRKNFDGEGV
jgi:hypothetical protein